jgi:dipeptidyl aminopeptidase/acylaminoacyl peptidase
MPPRLTPEHLYDLRFASHPAVAPEAGQAAYVLSEVVRGEGEAPPRYRHRLRLLDLDVGTDRALTQGEADRAPRWSPSGRQIAYLAPLRSEALIAGAVAQLHLIDVGGGEARPATRFAAGVLDHRWLPDGRGLVVTTRGDWRDEAGQLGRARVTESRKHKEDGRGWVPPAPVELWRVPLQGEPRRLWRFDIAPAPDEIAVSPDGKHLVYLAAGDQDEADMERTRLWLRPLRGGAATDLLGRPGHMTEPSVSPDGRWLAYFEPLDPEDTGSPTALAVVPLTGGERRVLSGRVAARPSTIGDTRLGTHPVTPCWTAESDALVVAPNREGRAGVARVDLGGALTELAGGDRVVTAFDAVAGRVLMLVETQARSGQLHLLEPDGSERVLTAWNDDLLGRHRGGRPAGPREVRTEDGQSLTYWRLEPVAPRRDRAMVVQIHGGPYTNYGYGFVFEFHCLAAAGYTVVYGNPRGGSSFGSDFAGAIKGRYGTVDAADVMAIVEDAASRHPRPGAPVHVTGGSYGGFMTNWLVAHTGRFRSVVTQRSICNWVSFYGTSDIGPYFSEQEQRGTPWDDAERLWDRSPLKHVASVTTPTLVIHAEEDHRCPIEQAEQWFTALKRLGRAPTRLVRVPGEGHELSRSGRPDRRVERLAAILDWFGEHA